MGERLRGIENRRHGISRRSGRVFLLAGACLLLAVAAGAAPVFARSLDDFRLRDFKVGGDFTLTNQYGGRTSLSEFRGKVVMLVFGYTHCPDVCPATMVDVAHVLKKLKGKADSVRALFVTIDPARDTPERLRDYLRNFHATIVGMTGPEKEIAKVAGLYSALYRHGEKHVHDRSHPHNKKNGLAKPGYSVAHSSYVYLVDRAGAVKYILPYDVGKKILLKGVKALMEG